MPLHSQRGKYALALLALLLLGALCATVLYLTHEMRWPEALVTPGTLLARVVYWLGFPLYAVFWKIFPLVDHHFDPRMWIAVGMMTPFMWLMLIGGPWMLWRNHRGREAESDTAQETPSPSRRAFIGKVALGGALLTMTGVGTHGTLIAPGQLKIRRRDLALPGLPESLNGLRVVHVSDTHLGPFTTEAQLRTVMREINALEPDIALLTGDYVHRHTSSIVPGIRVMSHLTPRLGSVAVLGNHDHWEGADECRRMFAQVGIPLIDNDRLFVTPDGLTDATQSEGLCLAGLGDLWTDTVDPERALREVPDDMPRLVLAHNPDTAEQMDPRHRIDLMLSGHTHGGQVRIPLFPEEIIARAVTRYGLKYMGGWCEGPTCPVLVSCGIGISGVPMRLNVPPEVGLITLTRG